MKSNRNAMTDEEYIEREFEKLEERELDEWMKENVGEAPF